MKAAALKSAYYLGLFDKKEDFEDKVLISMECARAALIEFNNFAPLKGLGGVPFEQVI